MDSSPHNPGARLYRVFFAREAPENRLMPTWAKYLLPLLFFAIVWALTYGALHYRYVYFIDDEGYIATAQYVQQHGHLSTEDNQLYRQFPGESLLMIIANLVTGNMRWAGHLVVIGSALLAILLVQHLFDDFRLTILFTFFFPWWVATTTALFSEAPMVFCFLLGVWTTCKARPWSALYIFGLLAAGYGLVIRQTAAPLIIPFLLVYTFRQQGGRLRPLIGVFALSMLPFALYLAWNWFTIHEFFPQLKLQHEFMDGLNESADNRYSNHTFDVPFKGLITAFTDPVQSRGKKIDVFGTLALVLGALGCLMHRWRYAADVRERDLAIAFAAALLAYFLFHMSIGGVSSFRYFERYLCPTAIIVEWAIVYRRPLRWPWIILLLAYSLVFDISVHVGARSLGFIK